MISAQEREFRRQLRLNRQRRQELAKLLEEVKEKKKLLAAERDQIHQKAAELGIVFGKKALA